MTVEAVSSIEPQAQWQTWMSAADEAYEPEELLVPGDVTYWDLALFNNSQWDRTFLA